MNNNNRKRKETKKIFVLDTSALVYDPEAIRNFAEHDVVIPIVVLEELDNLKKKGTGVHEAAQEVLKYLDKLGRNALLKNWTPIPGPGPKGKIKVLMITNGLKVDANKVFAEHKYDHDILNVVLSLKQQYGENKKVILVTKDVALRVKASSLEITSEDYEKGKINDVRAIYTGVSELALGDTQLAQLHQHEKLVIKDTKEKYSLNHYYIIKGGNENTLTVYQDKHLSKIHVPHRVMGITPKNDEQRLALHSILDSNIRLVTFQGVAGTGKTLIAIAGAMQQLLHTKLYSYIYIARPIVALSNKDLGYLPGTDKDKILPYMMPLYDNIDFIAKQLKDQSNHKDEQAVEALRREGVQNPKLVITPLAYIRGRSIPNTLFIVDEAQNLTPHEVKTIVSRAGNGTKIIFTGDIFQIDTPYLDPQSNGLSYLIEHAKGDPLYAHVTLQDGVRSELANLANRRL